MSVIVGSAEAGAITCGEGPGMLNVIRSTSGPVLASRIACRSEPGPLSLVLVTTNVVNNTLGSSSSTTRDQQERIATAALWRRPPDRNKRIIATSCKGSAGWKNRIWTEWMIGQPPLRFASIPDASRRREGFSIVLRQNQQVLEIHNMIKID